MQKQVDYGGGRFARVLVFTNVSSSLSGESGHETSCRGRGMPSGGIPACRTGALGLSNTGRQLAAQRWRPLLDERTRDSSTGTSIHFRDFPGRRLGVPTCSLVFSECGFGLSPHLYPLQSVFLFETRISRCSGLPCVPRVKISVELSGLCVYRFSHGRTAIFALFKALKTSLFSLS